MNLNERINQKNNDLDAWNIHKKELAESCIKKIENNALRGKKYPSCGQIYLTELGENIGYEINAPHQALIISKNIYNKTGTVIVAPISSGKIRNHKHLLKCQYILSSQKYPHYLSKDSVVKLDQRRCISVNRLKEYRGRVNNDDMERIKKRIKFVLDID